MGKKIHEGDIVEGAKEKLLEEIVSLSHWV